MPIEWAHLPTSWGADISGYGDILRHVRKYRRLDTYDLTLSSYEHLDHSLSPERREAWMDNQVVSRGKYTAKAKAKQRRQRYIARHKPP
jgi:hypothetical protein